MKSLSRFALLMLIILVLPSALAAQGNDVIVLNDTTPSVNIVVTLPTDATGVVALDFMNISVRMTDAGGNTVFYTGDSRMHALELSIAPNTGSHNLVLERMPGVVEAYARVNALAQLTDYSLGAPQIGGDFQLISTSAQPVAQRQSLVLASDQPGGTLSVALPSEQIGVIGATFANAQATTQLVDAGGVLMASSFNGHIDGMNAIVDGGAYMFTILSSGVVEAATAQVSALPVVYSQDFFPAEQISAAEQGGGGASVNCYAQVSVSSVSLRSGPGAGYSVTGYGFSGESLPVGGSNPSGGWYVVGKDGGSAWVFGGGVQLSGECSGLPVFSVPFRDAPQAQVVIVTQPPQYVAGGGSGSGAAVGGGSYESGEDGEDDDGEDDDGGDDDGGEDGED